MTIPATVTMNPDHLPDPPHADLMDDALEPRLIEISLSLFGTSSIQSYQPPDLLVREGGNPGGIWLVLEGQVELFRTIDNADVIFHSESAGRMIGLMALSEKHPTFFSCRARTPVKALFITNSQILQGMAESVDFSTTLMSVMVRSMARRNRRSAQLLVKVRTLNQRLSRQRDDLEAALESLKQAQDQLIQSEKMATLGNLAAGMAHELNNPVAAIQRATEFIHQDLTNLLSGSPNLDVAAAALPVALNRSPLGTREEREAKSNLTHLLDGDRNLASRLFAAGIRSSADLQSLLSIHPTLGKDEQLRQIEHGGQLGASLRTLENCSHRIADLVRSLKLHARDSTESTDGVDLNQTIEDALVILSNKLTGIEVIKHYAPLPTITAWPSQLQQVWINLLVNAAQALNGSGTIEIITRLRPDAWIEADIIDNGPGIPKEIQDRLFEHRFTTRNNRVEFGLGLGLPISRMIVTNHSGLLSFQSSPAHTRFRVEIPSQPLSPPNP